MKSARHDAHGDGEVSKCNHDHELHCLLNGHPQRAALPDQGSAGRGGPSKADTCAETPPALGAGRGEPVGWPVSVDCVTNFPEELYDAPSRRQGCYMAGGTESGQGRLGEEGPAS